MCGVAHRSRIKRFVMAQCQLLVDCRKLCRTLSVWVSGWKWGLLLHRLLASIQILVVYLFVHGASHCNVFGVRSLVSILGC